jgi:hypothetical protein
MSNNYWYCPAKEQEIDWGLCYEYCFIGFGGPISTADELEKWIRETRKFKDIKDFQKVCEKCVHCQW